jgi:hypothetical protein
MSKIDSQLLRELAVFQDSNLGERPMNIYSDNPHSTAPLTMGADGLHDIYGSALAAQPGQVVGAAK